ncbi:hypothetical protein ABBQ32_003810 [Trebouxia sp. C0010 RCD-2024]
MVNTLHKQVIHAVLQPVMLRAPSCGLRELHTGSPSRALSYAYHTRLRTNRSEQQLRASNHQPLQLNHCKAARHATAAPFSKAVTSPLPCLACRAGPAGHTASLPVEPAVNGPGLSGMAPSDSEASDDDEADSAVQVADLSNGQTVVDEAVTGYIQEGSAETVLVKSKEEAHEQIEALILSANSNLTLREIEDTFQFPLDRFQKEAVQMFLTGSSVLVCAPTGAGKTAIAEAAAVAVLSRGQRVIYTTPLKALSNQKLFEMRERFGTERVGLSTGDASIQTDSAIMVMTTEILRNIMYRTEEEAEDSSTNRDSLADVGMVVLDEVHYLGNEGRGTVWEEIIINCPSHIQMLAMSATVANPDDLGSWITKVHGQCQTVMTRFRPVPLTWHYCHTLEGRTHLVPLLNSKGTNMSAQMLGDSDQPQQDEDRVDSWLGANRAERRRRRFRREEPAPLKPSYQREQRWRRIPPLHETIEALRERDYLPAIWFIFSRAGCDKSAKQAYTLGAGLTTPEEQAAIMDMVTALKAEQPEAVKEALVAPLLAGLASHHAGCLPAWKALLERCFQQGLLKVVFATETLAAGINMPARTTVISTLSRRRDTNHSALLHNELLQMAGRAGRRGFDTAGHCVILQNGYEEGQVAWDIIRKGPERLQSQFAAGYGMVLNLLYTRSLQEAKAFIDRSFNSYLSGEGREKKLADIDRCEQQAAKLVQQATAVPLGLVDEAAWREFQKLKEQLEQDKRDMAALTSAFVEHRAQTAADTLEKCGLPWVVGLDLTTTDTDMLNLASALAVKRLDPPTDLEEPPTPGEAPPTYYLCLMADNRLVLATSKHIAGVLEGPVARLAQPEVSHRIEQAAQGIAWEDWVPLQGGAQYAQGTALTAIVAARVPPGAAVSPLAGPPELEDTLDTQRERVRAAKKAYKGLRARKDLNIASRQHSQLLQQAEDLQKRASKQRERLDMSLSSTWRSFQDLVACLVACDALQPESLTALPLGHVARQIHGENELWLAMVLTHPAVQSLTPPQLAGVLGAILTSENISKPQVWVAYEPTAQVVDAVQALEPERERLYKVQVQHGVQAPLAIDLRLAGVIEAWAAGSSWSDIMKDSSLDDGDIARLLSRTVDLLRHARFCDGLLVNTQIAARKAMKAMNRNPIADLIQ